MNALRMDRVVAGCGVTATSGLGDGDQPLKSDHGNVAVGDSQHQARIVVTVVLGADGFGIALTGVNVAIGQSWGSVVTVDLIAVVEKYETSRVDGLASSLL